MQLGNILYCRCVGFFLYFLSLLSVLLVLLKLCELWLTPACVNDTAISYLWTAFEPTTCAPILCAWFLLMLEDFPYLDAVMVAMFFSPGMSRMMFYFAILNAMVASSSIVSRNS